MSPIRNDRILTDQKTQLAMFDHIINEMVADGRIFSREDWALYFYALSERVWEMTPDGLLMAEGTPEEGDNPIIWGTVPAALRGPDSIDDEIEFNNFILSSTNGLAADAANYMVCPDSEVVDSTGEDVIGTENCPLIVVHEDTTQLGGFIPLVRSIRELQARFGLAPVAVWVHNGTRRSLRLFEEEPITPPPAA